jgi:hypothetical protein
VPEALPGSLLSALADLTKWLNAAHIPSMVIGGIAASVLGRPRVTQDIDALILLPEEDWQKAIEAAGKFKIVPRIEGALEFARRSRVLLMRHVESGIDLDITFGGLHFEELAIEGSQLHDVGGIQVRLPRVEDLLVMKAIARRPKDLEDIRGLLAAHPKADTPAARRWVREFSVATGMSDMLDEFDRLLEQYRPNDQ